EQAQYAHRTELFPSRHPGVRGSHVEGVAVRVDRRTHRRPVDPFRDRVDERVELRARVCDAQRHRRAHLVSAEVSNRTAQEASPAAAPEGLAHHSLDAESRVDVGRPQLPAVGVPPEEDALIELRAEAAPQDVAGARRAEPADVDPAGGDAPRDHVRPRRVVGVQAARARREDEQDRRKTDREDALFHPIPVIEFPPARTVTRESSGCVRRLPADELADELDRDDADLYSQRDWAAAPAKPARPLGRRRERTPQPTSSTGTRSSSRSEPSRSTRACTWAPISSPTISRWMSSTV